MHHVVELYFDEETELALKRIQQRLVEAGICSELLLQRPHVSLSSFEPSKPDIWAERLEKFSDIPKQKIKFNGIKAFSGENSLIYLAVDPNTKLTTMHEQVHSWATETERELHPLYFPEKVVFHSSLTTQIDLAHEKDALELACSFNPPKEGWFIGCSLVEYSPAKVLVDYQFAEGV